MTTLAPKEIRGNGARVGGRNGSMGRKMGGGGRQEGGREGREDGGGSEGKGREPAVEWDGAWIQFSQQSIN